MPRTEESDQLRKAISKLGIRQVGLAAISGRSPTQIGKMCNGRAAIPDYIWGILNLARHINDRYWLTCYVRKCRKVRGK